MMVKAVSQLISSHSPAPRGPTRFIGFFSRSAL